MNEIGSKVKSFVNECLSEYPEEPTSIEVRISIYSKKVTVSLSNIASPLFYNKEKSLDEISSNKSLREITQEVY